ncbi:MAG: D-2-hydroxyacid dehydrogenase, partial [Actinobacteria bacterium]
ADERELASAAAAEVALGGNNAQRVRQLLDATPKLRWYQSVGAGVDTIPLAAFQERGIVLTNNSGSYDIQIAEHVMMFVFAASRQLQLYRDRQLRREWKDHDHSELRGATIVVYGLGSIGAEVARLASAVGMRVIGVRRRAAPEAGVARVVASEQLADVVGEADYLAITAPLTPATRGAISRDVIARMKPTAWILNIGRGAIVDEAALTEALQHKKIAGAALDVFAKEPLPQESPLWAMENVIITPHTSGDSPRVGDRTLALFAENLRRFKAGEPLLNRVDFGAGY